MAKETFGDKLREETIGCHLTTRALSTRRAMTTNQVEKVAETFEADKKSVSAGRVVINRKMQVIAPVYSLLLEARHFINARTIDYPMDGIRLCRKDQIENLAEGIQRRRDTLAELLQDLDANWASVKAEAKQRLNMLYSDHDYPDRPSDSYGLYISFPAIRPDDSLLKLNPKLYKEEEARIRSKFTEAVQIAEAAVAKDLQDLLNHLIERLLPSADGKKKVLKSSAIDNIRECVDLFRVKTIGSNAELEKVIDRIDKLASGVEVESLRKASAASRQKFISGIQEITQSVDSIVQAMPVRRVLIDDLGE